MRYQKSQYMPRRFVRPHSLVFKLLYYARCPRQVNHTHELLLPYVPPPMYNRWLGVRLEAMGATMNLAAALFIVFSKTSGGLSVKGGVAGLVLTYTQQVSVFQ